MKKKIMFFANHASFFISHRLNIYEEVKKKKYDFFLIIGKSSSKKMEKIALKKLNQLKIPFTILNFNSYNFNLINDIKSIIKLFILIKKFKPDVFHSVAPKPNLYGGLVSLFLPINKTVISLSGMGFLFTGNLSFLNFIKKILYLICLKLIFLKKNLTVIVQNKDDYKYLVDEFKIAKKIKLIKGGSGIKLDKFSKIKRHKNKNIVFSARLVKSKGIIEFIKAAKILKKQFPKWNFLIFGADDYKSHDSFNINEFKELVEKKIIIIKGYETNIVKILKNTEIFCLPTHREGFPKSVMEASAAGIPCIVSDAIGSKESIVNNKTGLLFKNRDYKDLIKKLKYLISNPKKRVFFSKNSKLFVKKFASVDIITKKIYKIYDSK